MPAAIEEDIWTRCERGYRSLLWRVRPRRLQRGVERLLDKQREAVDHAGSVRDAYGTVYARAAGQVLRRLERTGQSRSQPSAPARAPLKPTRPKPIQKLLRERLSDTSPPLGPDFHCDAAMGGLARWLWGAGYLARWWPDVDDDDLLGHALQSSAILLTADRRLMTRGVIARGLVPAFLVPIALKKREQFALIMRRLQLPLKPPRCMACGERLAAVDKESARERIPPRTYAWLADFFQCVRCKKLFWKGTHWHRIESELRTACANGASQR